MFHFESWVIQSLFPRIWLQPHYFIPFILKINTFLNQFLTEVFENTILKFLNFNNFFQIKISITSSRSKNFKDYQNRK